MIHCVTATSIFVNFTSKLCVTFRGIRRTFPVMSTNKFIYPPARRDATVDDYNGIKIADPYRWLESPDSTETKAFVNAQNEVTMPYLLECKYRETIQEKITRLWNYPKVSTPFRHGSKYFQYRNTGLQNQSVIYIMETLESEGSIFLDPNTLSPDGTISLQASAFSEDGRIFAYGLSHSGSDWIEVKFKKVDTGKDYPEVLKKLRYTTLTWMHDNIGFFYGGYLDEDGIADGTDVQSSENQKLYYHKLGTEQSEDIAVVEFNDPHLRIGAKVSHCGNFLIITPVKGCKNNLLYIGRLESTGLITGKIDLQPIVTKFSADFEYITNNGTKFYFRTNQNASNYCVIEVDLEDCAEEKWRVVIPEHERDVLDWAKCVNDNILVVCYLHDVKNVLQLHDLTSGIKKLHEFKIDVGTISCISGKRKYNQMFFSFCSFLTPNVIYQVDWEGDQIKQKVYHETKVGDFDKNLYETNQIFYKSKDGVEVPMFIVSRKGTFESRDENTPCWLYGYGGFNVNLTPSFTVSRIIFIDHFRGMFALPNIRGGGEYGNKWHDGARFENKQNCFDDFQYAAKYLCENGFTKKEKLVIQGGSNGGLLVAACINQTPELFGAAICQVGVLDMLRYHLFTIGHAWKSDYGCAEEEEQFKYLIKYSPLHNIFEPTPDRQYPASLFLTADHDDRVVPLHSLKFIAELQHIAGASPHQTNPLMICVETHAGHGGGKPTTKMIEELTNVFCFISRSLNLPFSA